MKTTEEQIAVMQHYANGGEIEFSAGGNWHNLYEPQWNWADYDYRIKEQKKKVTIEKWLIQKTIYAENECLEIIEGNKTLFDSYYDDSVKIKLLETYEVEI